jgi:hypothetical protein
MQIFASSAKKYRLSDWKSNALGRNTKIDKNEIVKHSHRKIKFFKYMPKVTVNFDL